AAGYPTPALAIAADVPPHLCPNAEQANEEARLADAGGAHEDRYLAGLELRTHLVAALATQRARREHGESWRQRFRRANNIRDIVAQVGLVEDNDPPCAALPCHRQVALDAARVAITVQRAYDEHPVPVGSQDLLLGPLASRVRRRSHSRELGPSLEQSDDDASVLAGQPLDEHPVSGCRQSLGHSGFVEQAAANRSSERASLR